MQTLKLRLRAKKLESHLIYYVIKDNRLIAEDHDITDMDQEKFNLFLKGKYTPETI